MYHTVRMSSHSLHHDYPATRSRRSRPAVLPSLPLLLTKCGWLSCLCGQSHHVCYARAAHWAVKHALHDAAELSRKATRSKLARSPEKLDVNPAKSYTFQAGPLSSLYCQPSVVLDCHVLVAQCMMYVMHERPEAVQQSSRFNRTEYPRRATRSRLPRSLPLHPPLLAAKCGWLSCLGGFLECLVAPKRFDGVIFVR